MALMTMQQWKDKTSRILTDRKNPLITDLDVLIGAYHRPGATDVQKHKLLILIRHYCREWLRQKSGKKGSFRRKYLEELLDQTTLELQSPAMVAAVNARKAGGNAPRAGKQMHENMIEVLQPRGTAAAKHGLTAGLAMPRASAPNVENALETYNTMTQAGQANPIDAHDMVAVLDFIQDQQAKGQLQRHLEYMQKADRLAAILDNAGDGLFRRGSDPAPYNTTGGRRDMYAVDQMEFIYVSAAPAIGGTFHHTSFLSGKPVLCAGEMEIQNGVLVHVDNGSGHYQPTTQHLVDCVRMLERKYNVDLSRVSVMDFSQPTLNWANAAQFLMFGGRPIPALPQPPARVPVAAAQGGPRPVARGLFRAGSHRK